MTKHPLYKSDRLALCVYEHLLMTCSYKKTEVEGLELKPLQRVTTYNELGKEMNMYRMLVKAKIGVLSHFGLVSVDEMGREKGYKKILTVHDLNEPNPCSSERQPMSLRATPPCRSERHPTPFL